VCWGWVACANLLWMGMVRISRISCTGPRVDELVSMPAHELEGRGAEKV
jgi:hypothetical protein